MLDAAPDAVLAVRGDATIVYANSQVEKLFGYQREELVGAPVERLVPERFRAAHTGHRGRYFEHPVTRPMGRDLDLYALRKDGSEFPAEISLSALETREGLLATAAIRDVTERRLAEQALADARAELQRRELARRQAVDINDNIVQGLTVALYDARRHHAEAAESAIQATLEQAKRIVAELQEAGETEPGELRREDSVPRLRPE